MCSAGHVSGLLCRVFREKGVTINKAPGDDEILKHRRFCLFQLLRLALRLGGDERQQQQCGERGEVAA